MSCSCAAGVHSDGWLLSNNGGGAGYCAVVQLPTTKGKYLAHSLSRRGWCYFPFTRLLPRYTKVGMALGLAKRGPTLVALTGFLSRLPFPSMELFFISLPLVLG